MEEEKSKAAIDLNINNKIEEYAYKSISVPGGGFVTGFVFHQAVPNILYCRTDIGGCYRYDFEKNYWASLIDHATGDNSWETYPLAIALDMQNPSYVYTMVGDYLVNKIGFSEDYGAHWVYYDAPVIDDNGNTAAIHGNAAGRSTGERLVVDPKNSKVLYLGTMKHGLWKTIDGCKTWTRLQVAYPEKNSEDNICFVEIDPKSQVVNGFSKRIIVGTNGKEGSTGNGIRGQSVYISNDGGKNFKPLKGEPKPVFGEPRNYPGYVAQRASFMGNYLFISYTAYNLEGSNWDTYGCDFGRCYDGALYRFELDEEGEVIQALDITPKSLIEPDFNDNNSNGRRLGYGISGVCADPQREGTLICSTILAKPDTVYRSTDYGVTWEAILSGLTIGNIEFNVSYQRPEYNGNASLIHWMSDLKINPFDSNMAFFNTGAGIFMTKDLTKSDQGEAVTWSCCDDGVEETVHLNVYSPPSGEVKVIDIIGDYGGFVFKDLDKPAENTFANHNKDRWITAMNADFPDCNPNIILVAPRGNWTGKTKGGIIASFDQGENWIQLSDPVGITEEIDEVIKALKKPNVTAGWVAISSDGEAILWTLGDPLYASRLVYTEDMGKTWFKVRVIASNGEVISQKKAPIKVMADRVNSEIFYGFGDNINGKGFYVSKDKGKSFHQIEPPKGFPEVNLAGIDGKQIYEIRVEAENEGVIWMAMKQYGLWKVIYDSKLNIFIGVKVSKQNDYIKGIGIGKSDEGSKLKSLYTSGTINGQYGFYRSDDGGNHWIRINDDKHQYGDIRSISGDLRVFGRIYLATGTRGLVYGDKI
jgi:photosystem II stability/assembly factor-like uncharacterized protein